MLASIKDPNEAIILLPKRNSYQTSTIQNKVLYKRQTLTIYNESRIRSRQTKTLQQTMIIHFIRKFKQMCYLLKVKVAFETTFTSLAMIYEKLFPWEV